MFVHHLNREQQAALLYLAREVAKADGFLHELQLGLVEVLKKQSEAGVEETEISIEALPKLFDTEKAKCSLLLELIGVAHANHEYHVNEKDLIGRYAEALGVDVDKLFELESWVERQLALYAEAGRLLEEK